MTTNIRAVALLTNHILRQVPLRSATRSLASLSGGQAVAKIADEFPHMDAVRFLHKNQKFAFKDVDTNAEEIACGFCEQGFQPGDIVLSWIPNHFSEQVRRLEFLVVQSSDALKYRFEKILSRNLNFLFLPQTILEFACSKAGFILYKLDPNLGKNPEAAKRALKSALEITKANIFVTQEAGSDVNYVRLVKEVIPEIRVWDFSEGLPFLSPRFPHLRYPVHTGFDFQDKIGMIPYRHMLSPSGDLPDLLKEYDPLKGSTPLYGEFEVDSDGIPTSKGKIWSNDEVKKANNWPIYNCILNKEYKEIEGIGNIW
mmetsp:Transcript_2700/g.3196  ORF Transcript_2700/g.3196 Transcript_2700/m.3196 type:complete len:313 (+) Transcript_2700:62-1000(+)